MEFDLERTIVAVSSGLAPARRAIVRISGSQTGDILRQLIAFDDQQPLLSAKTASAGRVRVGLGWSRRLSPATVYYWPNNRSFTGQPSAELHVLGGLPIVESLTEHILSLGARLAERGEFTLRSFLAGKLDLTQAEAVLGVIEADSDAQLAQALEQLGGNLSTPVRELRDQLIELIAHLEAGLDFVEEDIEFITAEQLSGRLSGIGGQLQIIIERLQARSPRARAPRVILVGLPNAGKSTLFNALVGCERAIVTPRAGTTRDAVKEEIRIDDLPVELVDTAGIEALHNASPRAIAQEVLGEQLKLADLALLCVDLDNAPSSEWILSQQVRLGQEIPQVLLVGTKIDLAIEGTNHLASAGAPERWDALVSPSVPESINELRQTLRERLSGSQRVHASSVHDTALRSRGSLELAQQAIGRALDLVASQGGDELVAAELRNALDDLSAVIGEVHSDDILGQIFSRFCIGK